MPSFGLGELILIGLAIIVFVRPEDLPKLIRNLGKFYAEIRRIINRYQTYTQETLNEISRIDSTPEKAELKPLPSPNANRRTLTTGQNDVHYDRSSRISTDCHDNNICEDELDKLE